MEQEKKNVLCGRVALIPGAIRGIGLEIARMLGGLGCSLVLPVYDWLDCLDDMKLVLDEMGVGYVQLHADLRQEYNAARCVKAALEAFGRLDYLINNIERGGWPVVHGPYTERQWRLEWETTINAKWYLYRHSLAHLRMSMGAVVNISSIAGVTGRCGPAGLVFNDCYSLSNRAVSQLTEQWAREAAPEVRVNEIQLGFIATRHGPGTRGWGILREGDREAIKKHTLLKRLGTPKDVARAVVFLLKDAEFMTGASIRIDGGYILGGDEVPPMPRGVVSPDEPTFGGAIPPESD